MNSLTYKKDIIISNKIDTDIEIENNYKSNRLIPYEDILNYKTHFFKTVSEETFNNIIQKCTR
jgi:hypothetical protein